MNVLGIDPGLGTTGWAIVTTEGAQPVLRVSGTIRTNPRHETAQRLLAICDGIRSLLAEHAIDAMAIEDVFVAKDARAALALGQARGVAVVAAAMMGIPVSSYSALEAKQAVTGNGRASKEQVAYMIQSLLALNEPLHPTDCADAAAIALCHMNRVTSDAIRNGVAAS